MAMRAHPSLPVVRPLRPGRPRAGLSASTPSPLSWTARPVSVMRALWSGAIERWRVSQTLPGNLNHRRCPPMPAMHAHDVRQRRDVRASAARTTRPVRRTEASQRPSDPTPASTRSTCHSLCTAPPWDGSDHADSRARRRSGLRAGSRQRRPDVGHGHGPVFWRCPPVCPAQCCRGTRAGSSDHPWATTRPLGPVHGPDGPADAAPALAGGGLARPPRAGGRASPVRTQRLPWGQPGSTTCRHCTIWRTWL